MQKKIELTKYNQNMSKKIDKFKHLKYKAKIDIADYIKEFKNNYENK